VADEFFKEKTLTEEELKKFEEEESEIAEVRAEELQPVFGGEFVEKEYIVVDIQRVLPERSRYVRKIDLYVLGEDEPITVSVDHPKLRDIVSIIENFKLAKVRVKQLKVKVMVDGEMQESVTRDVEDIISVEPLEPLEYFKKHSVKMGVVMLRQGKTSPFLREDGVTKLVVSGYTINGMRLNASLRRDRLSKVLLVPAIIRKKDVTTIVVGCWFMLKRKEEKDVEDEVEEIVREVEEGIDKEQKQEQEQNAQKTEQTQKQESGQEEKLELELR